MQCGRGGHAARFDTLFRGVSEDSRLLRKGQEDHMSLRVRQRALHILSSLIAMLLLAGSIVSGCSDSGASPSSVQQLVGTTQAGAEAGAATESVAALEASPATQVAEMVLPSVVNIAVADAQDQPLGIGTGVIYRADGHIVTNNHVVTAGGNQPAPQILVTTATGDEFPATLVGRDPFTDLAVLRVEAEGLPAANFLTDLSRVNVGDYAIAIGTPLGLEGTVTLGIVSAVKREIQVTASSPPADYIQTDAAISPGNSGGALADARGNVIGINAAGLRPESGAQNIGFAIPSDVVVFVADQLINEGRVRYSYLGIQVAELTPGVRDQLGLGDVQGVVVVSVQPGSPAGEAGVEQRDVIVALAGTEVATSADLYNVLRQTQPGEQVEIVIVRGGEEQTLTVTLGERPSQ